MAYSIESSDSFNNYQIYEIFRSMGTACLHACRL